MTKKDYVKTAGIIKEHFDAAFNHAEGVNLETGLALSDYLLNMKTDMMLDFARIFSEDNPSFSRDKFVQACGLHEYEKKRLGVDA